jgi:replicative DNA helicase
VPAAVDGLIDPEKFFEPIHRKIFEICRDLIGKLATEITVGPCSRRTSQGH